MANAITFIEILTPQSSELADFYHNVFDWDVYPPMGAMEYRVMNPKAENGVMGAIGDPYAGENWVAFYVGVDDIDAMIEKVVANGGSVKVPKFTTDTGFTQAMVQDTKGHVIGLQQICADGDEAPSAQHALRGDQGDHGRGGGQGDRDLEC